MVHPQRYDQLMQMTAGQEWRAELPAQEYPQTNTEATMAADVRPAVIQLGNDRTALMDFVSSLPRSDDRDIQWRTVELVGQDDIFNPEHDHWPERCGWICEKPKTRQGIEKFYEHHPELRGVL